MNASRLKRLVCALLVICLCLSLCGCFVLSGLLHEEDEAIGQQTDALETEADNEADAAAYHEKVDEIVKLLERYYVDGYSDEELGDYLAQAVIASAGDRWSYYVSAEDFDAYLEDSNNAYVGIGVTIQLANEEDVGFTVVSVTGNSPAYKAGIETGDMIIAVDGVSITDMGMDMTEAQSRVRGEEGTDVTLTIMREGKTLDIVVTRGLVEVEVVTCQMLENNIGYIKINNFDANSCGNSLRAIEELRDAGASALIFDLRFNPGGSKDELVRLLDYLLPEGPLFRSVDYKGREEVDYSDEDYLDMPMAVLVNEDSYSAAEFFAAAMQEYGAAVIVGGKTTGKANYQQTFRLSDGSAIAISTGHYQTPNGVTLEGLGVTPDVPVEVDAETYLALYYGEIELADDPQLQAAIQVLAE